MKEQFLEEARQELVNGHAKKRHPFRYFVMATTEQGKPKQRTVVLRKTLLDLSLVFYTDSRTQKITDIQNNPECSALFYHPKKLLQLRVEGTAQLITDKEQITKYWHTVQANSRNDYSTNIAPGTLIKNPDEVGYSSEEHYFCPIKIIPHTIEYLRLKRPNHLRVLYSRSEDNWSGEFLVP